MNSPQMLADTLRRQWRNARLRNHRLLDGLDAWPLQLSIGLPSGRQFAEENPLVARHVQQWREISAHGPGQVQWTNRKYRQASSAVEVPQYWILQKPSDWITATQDTDIQTDFQTLADTLPQVDPRFHHLLVQRLPLWKKAPEDTIRATRIALRLEPGCAQGKPLRALSIAGNDSKFFQRYESLLCALLDILYAGEAGRQRLTTFLNASPDGEHWLLVVPLAEGLLPFPQLRVRTTDLQRIEVPVRRILIVENERSLHQLPPCPDTIAILGAGMDLAWMSAPWLKHKQIIYWGDMDTWGLSILAHARRHHPTLRTMLMNIQAFKRHQAHAIPEPTVSATQPPPELLPDEQAFFRFLSTQQRGRLEQEFLPAPEVHQALEHWLIDTHDE